MTDDDIEDVRKAATILRSRRINEVTLAARLTSFANRMQRFLDAEEEMSD